MVRPSCTLFAATELASDCTSVLIGDEFGFVQAIEHDAIEGIRAGAPTPTTLIGMISSSPFGQAVVAA